jgi:hypothetical protein
VTEGWGEGGRGRDEVTEVKEKGQERQSHRGDGGGEEEKSRRSHRGDSRGESKEVTEVIEKPQR